MVHCTFNTRKIENSHTRISKSYICIFLCLMRDLPVYFLLVYVGKFFEFLLIVPIFTFAYTYTAFMYSLHTTGACDCNMQKVQIIASTVNIYTYVVKDLYGKVTDNTGRREIYIQEYNSRIHRSLTGELKPEVGLKGWGGGGMSQPIEPHYKLASS
jgi:hypothetical protein